ncbi:glycerate kinase family protein [Lacrimispora defluvii]|uniref:Glycerate kinase n=1 Tax=Lacrimispora defluvii TaxID=2719233 RepID=A0ABX1VM19_9FIRM|nr:glycerate kinase [Lacrimispora defluvii]NNJ29395.1 glycerate kinase [Lacrimispora defluvii]
MKLLFASDSLKGTITSPQTIDLLGKAANEVFGRCEWEGIPVADGGEGTADAVISAVRGERVPVTVHGPLLETVHTYYGSLDENRAIIEMAAASGLTLIPESQRDPRTTTSFGTGEMIKDALNRGFTDISIAIGGSATNDGGMGCMKALGVRFLDVSGEELNGRGEDLIRVSSIDTSGLDPRLKQVNLTVMCDVNNPLCGPDGAAYTFGKQKGGTPPVLDHLENGMINYRDIIIQKFGINPDEIPGSGAAGGLGAALCIFLGGQLKSGIETVLDLIDFDSRLNGVSLVVTGEGRADWQSCFGKVMQGIGQRCRQRGIPAVALTGSMGPGAEKIYDYGIRSIMTTVNGVMDLNEAFNRAEDLYYQGAIRMFRLIALGMEL